MDYTVNITAIKQEVKSAIEDFASEYPTCYQLLMTNRVVDARKNETFEIIESYVRKLKFKGKNEMIAELENDYTNGVQLYNTGEAILSKFGSIEGPRQAAETIYTGLIEMRWIKAFLSSLKDEIKSGQEWQSLIRPELQNRLLEIEVRIKDKITDWSQNKRGQMIECAAFCQLLYDKNYFVRGCTNRNSVIRFALLKYGATIENQLNSSNREGRETHKIRLNRFFT